MDTSRSKNRCFLVSVGTSLIENYCEEFKSSLPFNREDLDEDISLSSLDINGIQCDLLENSNYKHAFCSVGNYINDQNSLQKLSAELKTLIKYGLSKNDKIILFPTLTYSGVLCAKILSNIFSKKLNINNIEIMFSQGLGSTKNVDFTQIGIPNLLSNISQKILENQDNYEIVIVITGGYKSLVPYFTLAGILYGKEIIYIYEESDIILTLPKLPINIDYALFKQNYPLLKNIKDSPKNIFETYYNNLHESLKNLIELQNDNYKYKPILEFLITRYLDLAYKSPLTISSQKDTILRYLERDNSKPNLRDYFSKLNNIAPYFWIGDKIPEMVDHSLRHHNNLFEIAELILLPILNKNKNYIEPEYLFILLSAIYFHDWGHSLTYLPNKKDRILLPTEIRDYHHILGYERLKDENWQKKLFKLLNWNGAIDYSNLWDKYLHAISLVGLYHRKDMPLKGDGEFCCPINKTNYKSLENIIKENSIRFEEVKLDTNKMIFITALFRVIDSLDTQYTRVETPDELIFKISMLLSDKIAFENQSEGIKKQLKNNDINKLDELFNLIITGYSKREVGKNETSNSIPEKDKLDIDGELDILPNKEIGFIYLNSKLNAFLKEEQVKHYLKHLYLGSPRIFYEKEKGKHKIIVEYRKNKDFEDYIKRIKEILYNELSNGMKNEVDKYENLNSEILHDIVEKIKEDYERVEEILCENNLIFDIKEIEV